MLHDLRRGFPGSKREGAAWAKTALDARWSDLIDRAWDGRSDPASKVKQPANPEDFARTLEFVGYVLREANTGNDFIVNEKNLYDWQSGVYKIR